MKAAEHTDVKPTASEVGRYFESSRFWKPGLLSSVLVFGCATVSEKPPSQRARDGTSCESAIVISEQRHMQGIQAEYDWLNEHYPGYEKLGQTLTSCGDKPADEIRIRTAGSEEKSIFFDISSFFGK